MSIVEKFEEAVPPLLFQLHEAKQQALQGAKTRDTKNDLYRKFKKIEGELNDMKVLFPKMKSLMEQFCVLEQKLDDDIFKDREMESSIHRKLDLITDGIVTLRSLISTVDIRVTDKLRALPFKPKYTPEEDDHHTISQEWVDLGIEGEIFTNKAMSSFAASFHRLGSTQVKMCLLCLSVFPENIAIKKKPLVYWWMGEGTLTKTQDKTAEEVGELVLQELLDKGFIRPSSEKKPPSVNNFIVCPWIRRMLILMAKNIKFLNFSSKWMPCNGERRAFLCEGIESYIMRNGEREEYLLTVFNVNEQYLGMRTEWLTKLKKVEVLQLGRWQNSITYHIEVENDELLKGLGSQKHLKYLSLRGISGIETLPPSIFKLISLQILDLKACYNLRELPPEISESRNLTHLDVSECYLLKGMPKGLDQLYNLQVLKGFVTGKADRNCQISDLVKLSNLRKLSIRVDHQGEGQQEDQLGSLGCFPALRILTVLWVVSSPATFLSLPGHLTKLDLRCMPFEVVPEWLRPSRLPNLEKLYIRGGRLKSLEHQDSLDKFRNVKFLRLKHLTYLNIDKDKLRELFPMCNFEQSWIGKGD